MIDFLKKNKMASGIIIVIVVIIVIVTGIYFLKPMMYESIENTEETEEPKAELTPEEKKIQKKKLISELFKIQKEYEEKVSKETDETTINMLNAQLEEIYNQMKLEIDSL